MRRIPLLLLVYLVIGVVVAYAEDYLENVDRTKRLLSAILAAVVWPLVLLGFDVKVTWPEQNAWERRRAAPPTRELRRRDEPEARQELLCRRGVQPVSLVGGPAHGVACDRE